MWSVYMHDTYNHVFLSQVSTNGLVSFGRPFTSRDPTTFPATTSDVFWRYIAAIFWADWLTIGSGKVSWELHTANSSQSLLEQVDDLIQREYGDTNFTGSWMLVTSWENVTDDDRLFEVGHTHCIHLVNIEISSFSRIPSKKF